MIRRSIQLIWIALAMMLATTVVPLTVAAQSPQSDGTLSSCVKQNQSLSSLFLIDASASLKKTDPGNGRVDAIQSALSALGTLHSATGVEVRVEFIEFSATAQRSFPSFPEWTHIPAEQDEQRRIASVFAERNEGDATDYVAALEPWIHPAQKPADEIGALEMLSRAPQGSCRLMVWFTDGQLDVRFLGVPRTVNWTDPPTLVNSVAVGEALSALAVDRMCSKGGLADRLRSGSDIASGSSAQIAVVALDPDGSRDFGLLQSFATEDGCGSMPPRGTFGSAGDIADLILGIRNPVLGPSHGDPSGTQSCVRQVGAVDECAFDPSDDAIRDYDFPFKLSAGVHGFNLLSLSSHSSVETSIITPSGREHPLDGSSILRIEDGAQLSVQQLDIEEGGYLIDADLTSGGSWSGQWRVRYSTSDADAADGLNRASIYVFGGLMVWLDLSEISLRAGSQGRITLRVVAIDGQQPSDAALEVGTMLNLMVDGEPVAVPTAEPDGSYVVPYRVSGDFQGDSVLLSASLSPVIRLSPRAPLIELDTWTGELGRVPVMPVPGFPLIEHPLPFDGLLDDANRQLSTTLNIDSSASESGGCIELLDVTPPSIGGQTTDVRIFQNNAQIMPGIPCAVELFDGQTTTLVLVVDAIGVDSLQDEYRAGSLVFRSASGIEPTHYRDYMIELEVPPAALVAAESEVPPAAPAAVLLGPESRTETDVVVALLLMAGAVMAPILMLFGSNLISATLDVGGLRQATIPVSVGDGTIHRRTKSGELVPLQAKGTDISLERLGRPRNSRRSVTVGDFTIGCRLSPNPFSESKVFVTHTSAQFVVGNEGTWSRSNEGRMSQRLSSAWMLQCRDLPTRTDSAIDLPLDGSLTLLLPDHGDEQSLEQLLSDITEKLLSTVNQAATRHAIEPRGNDSLAGQDSMANDESDSKEQSGSDTSATDDRELEY